MLYYLLYVSSTPDFMNDINICLPLPEFFPLFSLLLGVRALVAGRKWAVYDGNFIYVFDFFSLKIMYLKKKKNNLLRIVCILYVDIVYLRVVHIREYVFRKKWYLCVLLLPHWALHVVLSFQRLGFFILFFIFKRYVAV